MPITAKAVQVHESHCPGALGKVTHYPATGFETTLWEGTDPTAPSAAGGISTVPVSSSTPIQRIKLYLESQEVPGWNEIDAVGLVDRASNVTWAKQAWASTSYGRNNPLPSNVSGYLFTF
ncbi:MAG: hypothetical protein AAGD11_06975 [Planctomycetota bacterium]